MPIKSIATDKPVVMTTELSRQLKNADTFAEEFTLLTDASIGVLVVRTREAYRAAQTLHKVAQSKEHIFRSWQMNTGWQNYHSFSLSNPDLDTSKPHDSDMSTLEITAALKNACNETREGIYVMHGVHHHFEKPIVQQWIKDFVRISREIEMRLVFLVPETVKIPVDLEDDMHIMDYRAPSHAELRECWDAIMDAFTEKDVIPDFSEDDIARIIQNAVGMTWMEFEVAVALGVIEAQGSIDRRQEAGEKDPQQLVEDYTKVLLKHKTEAIKRTDILELMPAVSMDSVGGLDVLKGWLDKRAYAYSKDARDYGIAAPKGFLCVGPPGGGKSLVAKATSSVLGVPLVKFDIGKVFGKFVGESESRIRAAIKFIEAMAPCVLLLDEIDKGFAGMGGGGGDGGTSARVFGTILNWMQERDNAKYPVFLVMTANNVTGLPPELMRRGRLDEIFAVTFPSDKERVEILDIHFKKRGHTIPINDLRKVAVATEKYVGAELEGIVESSLLEAFHAGMEHPSAELIVEQAQAIRPLYLAFADRVNAMHEWAQNNAKAASTGMTFDVIEATERKTAATPSLTKPGQRVIKAPSRPTKPPGGGF